MWERVRKVLSVVLLTVTGLGVSIMIESIHQRLAADVNYASFCNVSATVNCDVVLGSRYATLAGTSIATWAILFYITTGALAAMAAASIRAKTREFLASAVLTLAVWGLLFSIYMAVIAFGLLHTVCVMCSALYVINIGLFVAAWRMQRALRLAGRRQLTERAQQDRWVLAGGAVAVVALLAIGSWEAFGRGVHATNAADIARERPDFYRWYLAQPLVQGPIDEARQVRGTGDAVVTIVEFSDFECGHCAAFHSSLEDLLRRSGQGVRVMFRHFPLDSACNAKITGQVHPGACLAAIASECAGDQGKFWEYHNLLFENQQQLDRAALIGYGRRLGLDVPRFTACLDSEEPRIRVERDAKDGAQLGIDSTPTVFINGRMIKGALDAELLAAAVTLARSKG